MTYIRYLTLVILGLVVTLLNVLLSPVLPFFIRDGYLPRYLSWFQTHDAPAYGDEAYHNRELRGWQWLPRPLFLYCAAAMWACRNAGYGYDHWVGVSVLLGYSYSEEGNTEANINRDATGLVTGVEGSYTRRLTTGGKDYFEWCSVWTSGGKWYRVHIGWHLHTIAVGQTRNLKLTFNRW